MPRALDVELSRLPVTQFHSDSDTPVQGQGGISCRPAGCEPRPAGSLCGLQAAVSMRTRALVLQSRLFLIRVLCLDCPA
eukprot:scaffold70405_cov35-Tisochrysis_lutea.AAC.1